MVAARCFKVLNKKDYSRFIRTISEDGVNHLIWSILLGVKGAEKNAGVSLLKETYDLYKTDHDKSGFTKAVMRYAARIKNPIDGILWAFIAETLEYSSEDTEIWKLLLGCIKNTEKGYECIADILSRARENAAKPDEYVLKGLLYYLAAIGMSTEVKRMVEYAIEKQVDPSGLVQYAKNPQKVLEDFRDYSNRLW